MTKSAEIKQELKKYNDANYSIRIRNQKWGQIVTVKTDLIVPENCADDSAANRRHEKEVKSIIDNMYYKLGMGGRIYIHVLRM